MTHNPTSVCRSHIDQMLSILRIKQLAHPLQHIISLCHGERQLHGIPMKPIVPLGLLAGPLPSDEHVVVVPRDGPLGQRLVGVAGVEIGARPNAEEDVLGDLVGRF